MYYLACTDQNCMKKVTEEGDGFRCSNCNNYSNNCIVRYIVSCKVSDPTGALWITIFDPFASKIIGVPAEDLRRSREFDESIF